MKIFDNAATCSLVLWFSFAAVIFAPTTTSFSVVTTTTTATTRFHNSQKSSFHQPLFLAAQDDEPEDTSVSNDGNFDGKGFAGYLGPYVAAFLASIAVTAAFVKFVLLDY